MGRVMNNLKWWWFRLRGAWWVLTDKSFGDSGSYRYVVYVAPESWRCPRCLGGFNGSLAPPPHTKHWTFEHHCRGKSPISAKRRDVVTHRVSRDPAPTSFREPRLRPVLPLTGRASWR